MNMIAPVLVWAAAAVIVYVYVGYPAMLWLLEKLRTRPTAAAKVEPTVTLLISAFNEARVIGEKLENALALEYPRTRLEIIVISDASSDETDAIVESYSDRGVVLLRMSERGGKTLGLNAAMKAAKGEIVVFSDANIIYKPDTIRRLVQNFADPLVGCVTGDSQYLDDPHSAAHAQENSYWGYERSIRMLESKIGSTVGGDGAIFAIRKTLYTPLSADAINDLVVPLQIVAKGYRAIFEPTAVGFEPSAGDFRKEFRRKRRIVNRSWRGVMSVAGILNPLRSGMFAWQVWSHKVLRWLVLPFLVLGFGGCVVAYPLGGIYQLGVWGGLASFAVAAAGPFLPSSLGRFARVIQMVFYFYLVNLAAILGVTKALSGRVDRIWAPERG